ncbi:MAG: class I SAM-dependent methyltransferase [bacterium]|nr:class I SAM-dependent methyltransferase [bacterium]
MDAAEYDRQIDWEKRLANEWPFYRDLFAGRRVRTVLDCACGTGRHAVLFARNGYAVSGSDIDAGMIAVARENAARAGAAVRFVTAAFSDLPRAFADDRFDAVICTGNSLSQLASLGEVGEAVAAMAAVCRPGGTAVLHILNYRPILERPAVARPVRIVGAQGRREFFQKIFIPGPAGVEALMVRVAEEDGGWRSSVSGGTLLPIPEEELGARVRAAGFDILARNGNYAGAPFDAAGSADLILTCERRHGPGA